MCVYTWNCLFEDQFSRTKCIQCSINKSKWKCDRWTNELISITVNNLRASAVSHSVAPDKSKTVSSATKTYCVSCSKVDLVNGLRVKGVLSNQVFILYQLSLCCSSKTSTLLSLSLALPRFFTNPSFFLLSSSSRRLSQSVLTTFSPHYIIK